MENTEFRDMVLPLFKKTNDKVIGGKLIFKDGESKCVLALDSDGAIYMLSEKLSGSSPNNPGVRDKAISLFEELFNSDSAKFYFLSRELSEDYFINHIIYFKLLNVSDLTTNSKVILPKLEDLSINSSF